MANKLLVFGGSGHAKDVIFAAQVLGYDQFEIVTTDGSCQISGLKAVKEDVLDPDKYTDWDCIAAIGNNDHRRRFYQQYDASLHFVSIISAKASISASSRIGKGVFIGDFAYVGPDAVIGDTCIVNTHSIVGHDVKLSDFTHIGPRVCLSGHVELGKSVFVGAGTVFNNGSHEQPLIVSDGVHIGMACQVTESIRHEGIRLIPKPNYIGVRS